MVKTVFKAHPIMIWRVMKPYLFILILPFVRAIFQYLTRGEIDGLLGLELIAFAFILIIAVLGWQSIKITVNNDFLTVEKGILIRSCAKIELSRLSSISLKQNLLDFIVGSVGCSINTEAGRPKKSDFDIKMAISDAKMLYNLVYDKTEMNIIRFSMLRIALLAATTSSAITGIIVGVPFINGIGKIIGVAISDVLLDGIDAASMRFNTYFPPIINTVTIVLIIAYTISFVISFLKNVNFRLKSGKENIEIRSGFIVQKKIMFAKSKVNNVCIEQTPLMRIIKKYCLRASVGGYGDDKGEKAVIIPVSGKRELKNQLQMHFPVFITAQTPVAPVRRLSNLNRFLYIPSIAALIIAGFGAIMWLVFPKFDRFILFLTSAAMIIDLYYVGICCHNYKFGKLCLGEFVSASGSLGFNVRELYCEKHKVGLIRLRQTPADRRHKTCKIKIVVRSENADAVKVKNIDKRAVLNRIKETFKTNITE